VDIHPVDLVTPGNVSLDLNLAFFSEIDPA